MSRYHASLFLFKLTLDSFNSSWWQNPKRALILNCYEIINILKEILAQTNRRNIRKKKEKYLLLCHTSMVQPKINQLILSYFHLFISTLLYLLSLFQLYLNHCRQRISCCCFFCSNKVVFVQIVIKVIHQLKYYFRSVVNVNNNTSRPAAEIGNILWNVELRCPAMFPSLWYPLYVIFASNG